MAGKSISQRDEKRVRDPLNPWLIPSILVINTWGSASFYVYSPRRLTYQYSDGWEWGDAALDVGNLRLCAGVALAYGRWEDGCGGRQCVLSSRVLSGVIEYVIGYYVRQWYDHGKLVDPKNIDFSKYDRINYAFFQPDEWADPQLLWGPYDWSGGTTSDDNYFCSWDAPGLQNCNWHDVSGGLLHLAHKVGTEVDNFRGIAADPVKRNRFTKQCVELIETYGFDGIGIDWEYPGYADHSGTPTDTVNFTLLLQAVRDKLGALGRIKNKSYGLTAALPCGPDKIDKIQVYQISGILTELNLMSYDLHGAWDALTGTNVPMFDQEWGDKTRRWSVHGCAENYVERGAPLSRINIGLPFYDRSIKKARGMKQFRGGADDINYHLDESKLIRLRL